MMFLSCLDFLSGLFSVCALPPVSVVDRHTHGRKENAHTTQTKNAVPDNLLYK